MKPLRSGRFKITPVTIREKGCAYQTFRVTGWLNGKRIRKQFANREEAIGEKQLLEVEAANEGGDVRARITRLSTEQLAEAESAFFRLGARGSLSAAVDWFLTTYRPPVTEMGFESAVKAFLEERARHVRTNALGDYRRTLRTLGLTFPERQVHQFKTADVQRFLESRHVGPKRFNNLRGDVHAFFAWCAAAPRGWIRENPVTPIPKFKVLRGVPAILTLEQARALMAYVETFAGPARSKLPAGAFVPYFALALFAGLRPAVPGGEIWKLGLSPDVLRHVDLKLGVIRILPEISKVKSVRQVKIRPNLAAWLERFPPERFPLVPKNGAAIITEIRKRFALSDDVLRHTFISMHVAAEKSLGAAALEAGNSEAMIRKHYLNLVGEADAAAFWQICPQPLLAVASCAA